MSVLPDPVSARTMLAGPQPSNGQRCLSDTLCTAAK